MYRRLARNYSFMAVGTAASSMFMMLATAVCARSLNTHDFGVLVLMQSAVLVLRGATSFSTQQPVIKLGSEAQAAGDQERLGEIMSMGLLADLAASILSLLIAASAILLFRQIIGLADRDVGLAWMFAASLLLTNYPSSNGIFRLFDRFGLLSLLQTLSAAGLFAAAMVLFGLRAGLQPFAWAWAAYLALSGQMQLWSSLYLLMRKGVPLRFHLNAFATDDGREMLNYCWSTWTTSSAEIVRTNGDSLLVGAIASVEAAGLYNVARQLAGLLRKFNLVYASAVFPEVSRLSARRDAEGARRLKQRMMWLGLAVGALSLATVVIFGHVIIHLLFGFRFRAAYWPFVILTGAAAAQLISHTPSIYVQIYRSPKLLLLLYLIATAAFLAAAVSLTFTFSIEGMALAHLLFAVVLIILCEAALRQTIVADDSDLRANPASLAPNGSEN